MLQDVLLTAMDMMKLEKLEIGGLRGRALNLHIQHLHQQFLEAHKVFTEKPNDCLDLDNKVRKPRGIFSYPFCCVAP